VRSRYDLESELKPFLSSDERLEWVGYPSDGPLYSAQDYIMIPMGLFVAGFAIFWMYMASSMGAPIFFVICGSPFLFIGLGLAFVNPFIKKWKNKKTVYGLTKSKLIIKTELRSAQVKTMELATLSLSKLTIHSNKTGNIYFKINELNQHRSIGKQILNVESPTEVYKQINEFIDEAKKL
jgi:ABC-type bacteriocin/lantibiotic exporter with double-glycine peptidase domain